MSRVTEECHESDMAGMMIMMIMIMVVSLYTSPICISVSSSIVDAKYQRHCVLSHLIEDHFAILTDVEFYRHQVQE